MKPKRLESIKDNVGLLFMFSVLAASLCLNVALGWKVKELLGTQTASSVRPVGIQAHAVLPAIPVTDEDGRPVTISFDVPRDTVLYVWKPSCVWCKLNKPNIQSLAMATKSHYRFIGLTTEKKGLKEYLAKNAYPFPVYVVNNPRLAAALGLNVTPQTAVVNPGGKVDRVWLGAFSQTMEGQVERFFNVKLPGSL
jgi:hypothetical protein